MREGWRWGANPPYKFVTDFSTRYLCEECLKLPIKLTSVSWKVYPIRLEEQCGFTLIFGFKGGKIGERIII